MVFEEYLSSAAAAGRTYEQLPERVRAAVPPPVYHARVRDACITAGQPWATSAAKGTCTESEYYTTLVKTFKSRAYVYPHHLAFYVNRVLRQSPFKYYIDVLFQALKDELSYDRLPNFMAADALRITGVGRNQYIDILNQCKAKKLMWRVNKGLARDLLPSAPLDVTPEPWWQLAVVNVGEAEFAALSPVEHDVLREACGPAWHDTPPPVQLFDGALLQGLHRKGLVYYEVPVEPGDRFSIPTLEGFVSNKTSDAADGSVDPMEVLLYSVLMAASGRMTVGELAGILQVDLERLQAALSLAARLGFAKRGQALLRGQSSVGSGVLQLNLGEAEDDAEGRQGPSSAAPGAPDALGGSPAPLATAASSSSAAAGPAPGVGVGEALAVVVDAEVTSYLMMGALSPGLKMHSVTLFEAGRISGEATMQELVSELWASFQMAQQLEGELAQLAGWLAGLATLLQAVQQAGGAAAGGGGGGDAAAAAAGAQAVPLELLRKESLQGLAPSAAAAMLAHSYRAVVPMAPLPGPPLPLQLGQPSPAYYGPSGLACTPWLQLALYASAGLGPDSLVVGAGRQLATLPQQLQGASHALLWGWPQPQLAAVGHKCWWEEQQPLLVEGQFLLSTLNELLTQTAVLAQPWPPRSGHAGGRGAPPAPDPLAAAAQVRVVDVPLPLEEGGAACSAPEAAEGPAGPSPSGGGAGRVVAGVACDGGGEVQVALPSALVAALQALGLARMVGVLRVYAASDPAGSSGRGVAGSAAAAAAGGQAAHGGSSGGWVPLRVQLGVPLYPLPWAKAVCRRMTDAHVLSAAGQEQHRQAQLLLEQRLASLVAAFGPTRAADARSQLQQGWSCAAGEGAAAGGSRALGKLEQQLLGGLPGVDLVFDGAQLAPCRTAGRPPPPGAHDLLSVVVPHDALLVGSC